MKTLLNRREAIDKVTVHPAQIDSKTAATGEYVYCMPGSKENTGSMKLTARKKTLTTNGQGSEK